MSHIDRPKEFDPVNASVKVPTDKDGGRGIGAYAFSTRAERLT